ncbi:tetratricopeptide repeat protein [Streptomyces sp. NBC_01317]|uniref:tetratricopeptide repeat protein n=1 Tax=Streptomyces sp. NBC_01317 TaxID=2903822 RepID=UPI002E0FF256|nr:tetratricopeptide repeat protein [Streptomyces sp. NBC_01317]
MAELIRRRQRFVGRRAELGAFRDNLGLAPDDEAHRFLFHVHGIAGVGKTSLVREWEKTARECDALTAYVDEAANSVPEALAALSAEFARQGHPFKRLDRLLETYRQRRHEAESASLADPAETAETGETGNEERRPPPSAAGTALATAGTIGLGMVPVVGAFAGVLDTAHLAEGADRLRAALSARFRNPDDVRLVLTPDQVLTPVLVGELTEVLRQVPWITLFFDTYERTAPFLGGWLHDLMTTERYGKLPLQVVVTLAGRQPFDTTLWDGFADFMTDVRLDPFTEDETRRLLAARSVTEETVVAEVLRLSGGLPVLVSTLAQNRPADPDDVGDPSATAVDRFLKWERDPLRRRVALECALPRGLDEDVFLAVVEEAEAGEDAGEDAAGLYDWLRALPFVTEKTSAKTSAKASAKTTAHAAGLRYHDVVRAPMLRLRRTRSPRGWSARHTALARRFAAWREEEETGPRADDRWESGRWRALRLEETYHSLCANPGTALAAALRDVAEACRESVGAARRCALALAEAGEDTDDAVVREWGRRLGAALDEDDAGVGTGVRTTLGLLLDGSALDTAGRAVAHRIRGRVLSAEGRYEPALADLDRSLALVPGRYEAYLDRAVTHRGRGDTPAALADFRRAGQLAPDTPEILRAWGETLRAAGRYEEAVALLDRAIEAAPGDAYATAVRGSALHRLGRHTEALADLDRAVALDGRYLWALVRRGRLFCALGEHDRAVADLDRAAEIAPDSDWIASERGDIHRLAGRYEEADRELTRALTLNPTHPSALAGRGATRHRLHRVAEALTDLDGAIALRPDYAWAIEYREQIRAESAAALSRARHHRQDSV